MKTNKDSLERSIDTILDEIVHNMYCCESMYTYLKDLVHENLNIFIGHNTKQIKSVLMKSFKSDKIICGEFEQMLDTFLEYWEKINENHFN